MTPEGRTNAKGGSPQIAPLVLLLVLLLDLRISSPAAVFDYKEDDEDDSVHGPEAR